MKRHFVFICLLLFGGACQWKSTEGSKEMDLPQSKITEVLDLLEIDPRPDLPIHINFGKKISNEVMLLTIHQSKVDSEEKLESEFKYKGHEVYVHKHPKYDDLLGRYNFFYDTDSPSWRVMIADTENGAEYFLMETLIGANASDTLARH